MVPHVDIHGWGHDHRGGSREVQRGEEVAGDALREVGEHVGRGGNDHERVNRLRDRDMFDGGIEIGLALFTFRGRSLGKHAGDDFFTGERSKGEGPDELLGGPGHHDLYADAAVL